MEVTATITNGEKRIDNNDKKKLTKVLSTKLSIEDYNRFQKRTNEAYIAGIIDEPSPSKLLRYLVTYPFDKPGPW
jgi:hypothetical protein